MLRIIKVEAESVRIRQLAEKEDGRGKKYKRCGLLETEEHQNLWQRNNFHVPRKYQ